MEALKVRGQKTKTVKMCLITEVVLIHFNVVWNIYQQNSRVLYTFIPNKWFGELFDVSPENFIFLKTFDSEFSYTELWFTDQNSNPLGIEDNY